MPIVASAISGGRDVVARGSGADGVVPVRVLLVVHGYPPRAWGGTEVYTHDLARALARAGDDVAVVAREADPARAEYAVRREDDGEVRVYLVNNTFRNVASFPESYRSPSIRRAVAGVVDRVRPDVAHLQHLTCLSTGIVDELGARRIPVLFTANDFWLICHRGQLLDLDLERCEGPHGGCDRCIAGDAGVGQTIGGAAARFRSLERRLPGWLAGPVGGAARSVARRTASDGRAAEEAERRLAHMRRVADRVDLFLAPSETMRTKLVAFGVPPKRIIRVSQGIDVARFERARGIAEARRGSGDGSPLRVGFVGSLMVSKAPHLLLEAARGIPADRLVVEVYGGDADYHGDGSYRRRVEPLLATDGVRWHGPVPHERVPEVLADLDVVVVPSVWLENAPFVIREAHAAGVPVVASDLGGMAEMVRHDVDGLLFAPGDAGALQAALQRLLDEPGLLARLREDTPSELTIDEDAAFLCARYREVSPRPRRDRSLAAVIVNYRTPREVELATRSLASSRRRPDRVIVVDNGSDDGSAERIRVSLPGVELVETGSNLGFPAGSNVGLRVALDGGADRLLLLNPDVLLADDALDVLEEVLDDDPRVGVVAPLLLDRSDPSAVASAGMRFGQWTGRMRHDDVGRSFATEAVRRRRTVAGASGCALLLRREMLEDVGLLDEEYFFGFEDLDLCLRARRAGWATVCAGDAVAYHQGSAAMGESSPARLYYATRNHLLVAARAAPLPAPASALRALAIVALNLAYAIRLPAVPTLAGLGACLRGARDHLRRRYGVMPGTHDE